MPTHLQGVGDCAARYERLRSAKEHLALGDTVRDFAGAAKEKAPCAYIQTAS